MAATSKNAVRSKAPSKKSAPESFAQLNYEHQLLSAGCDAALLKKFPTLATALAGILEFLVAEVLDLAGNAARDAKLVRIKTDHIYHAILNDRELSQLLIINDIHWHGETAVYSGPVRKVLKQVHPDNAIVADGLLAMNKICGVITEKMARGMGELADLPGVGEIITAFCKNNLPGELAFHGASEATEFLVRAEEDKLAERKLAERKLAERKQAEWKQAGRKQAEEVGLAEREEGEKKENPADA